MSYVYGVLGGGRQGTAAVYDFAKFGDAEKVYIGDISLEAAKQSAAKVNNLIGKEIAVPKAVDVANREQLYDFLKDIDAFLSAVPYWFNPAITEVAIEAKACMTDLGGNTDLVREQMKLDDKAEAAGVAIVPDCGQVPGMGTTLSMYAMSLLDKTDEIYMWDGGNDRYPKPPFKYILTFNIAGLTNEYYGTAKFLRDYEITEVPTFLEEDYELVEFPEPIGTMEAFVAGGGTSTVPWTLEGELKTFQNKTLRWPGHFREWKTFMDYGFLEEEKVEVNGVKVSPRDVLHTVVEPKIIAKDSDRDLVIVRVKALGEKDGKKAEALVEVIDYFDEETGFSAMNRTTGWDGSTVAIMHAQGITPRGVKPKEISVPPGLYVEEMRKRGIDVTEKVTLL